MDRRDNVREVSVEGELARLCRAAGGECFKLSAEHARGIPDRLVVLPHVPVCWVELKRPRGGRLSLSQRVQHEKLRRLGQRVELVTTCEQARALVHALTHAPT